MTKSHQSREIFLHAQALLIVYVVIAECQQFVCHRETLIYETRDLPPSIGGVVL
jgi:hypothetical protein